MSTPSRQYYKEVMRLVTSDEFKALPQQAQSKIKQVAKETHSKLREAEDAKQPVDEREARKARGILTNALTDLYSGMVSVGKSGASLAAWTADIAGAKETAKALDETALSLGQYAERITPAADPESWVDFGSQSVLQNAPMLAASVIGGKAIAGSKILGGLVGAGRAALGVPGLPAATSGLSQTAASFLPSLALYGIPGARQANVEAGLAETGKLREGKPFAEIMMALPYAWVENTMGIGPSKFIGGAGQKASTGAIATMFRNNAGKISKALQKPIFELSNKHGVRGATGAFSRWVADNMFGEAGEEVVQGIMEIAMPYFADLPVEQAIARTIEEIGRPETTENLALQAKGGLIVGGVLGGGRAAISAVESKVDAKASAKQERALKALSDQASEILKESKDFSSAMTNLKKLYASTKDSEQRGRLVGLMSALQRNFGKSAGAELVQPPQAAPVDAAAPAGTSPSIPQQVAGAMQQGISAERQKLSGLLERIEAGMAGAPGTMADYAAAKDVQDAGEDTLIAENLIATRGLPDSDPRKIKALQDYEAYRQKRAAYRKSKTEPQQQQQPEEAEPYPGGEDGLDGARLIALNNMERATPDLQRVVYDPNAPENIPLLPYQPEVATGRRLPGGEEIKLGGADDIIKLKSGKPFKSPKDAQGYQAKNNLKESHAVVPVRGGFVLMKKPSQQKAVMKTEPGEKITPWTGALASLENKPAAQMTKSDRALISTEIQKLEMRREKLAEKNTPGAKREAAKVDRKLDILVPKMKQLQADVTLPAESKTTEPAKPFEQMTDEEWLASTRFYRSGKIKSAQLPNGKKVILSQGSTQTNFRENDRDFLLGLRPKTKANQPAVKQPEPAAERKPAEAIQKPAEPVKQPASNSQYSVVQMSDGKFKILKPDGKGYAIGTSREWAEEISAGMNKSLVQAKTVAKSAYKTEPFQGGFRVLDPEGKQYSWHTSKQAAEDKAAELNGNITEQPEQKSDTTTDLEDAKRTLAELKNREKENGMVADDRLLKKIAAYEKIIREAEAELAQKEEANDQPEVAKTVYQEQTRTLGEIIQMKLESGEELKINDLYAIANEVFEGTQADGVWNIKDLYDSLELGVNLYLLRNQEMVDLFNSGDIEAFISKVKTDVLARIPTQTKRTEEMDEFQQFSTPPSIASLSAWLANINKNDSLLEPSAGIGGLAIFGKMAGAKVVVNELSQRRAEILSNLPFDQFFTENGEQINNILPDDVAPTVVVMNPPFSSTAGRVKGERKTKNGGVHVEQALKRLRPGGRLVAIVGQGMSFEHSTFRDWWNKIKSEYNVLANVGLSGQEYKKYGTTFDNRILVIDKTGATTGQPVSGDYNNIESMIDALQGVRNVRQAISPGTETSSADANKSEGRKTSRGGGGGRSSKRHGNTGLRTDQGSSRGNAASRPEENTSTDERSGLSDSSGVDVNNETASNNETVRPDGDEQGRSERDNGKNTAGNDKSSASESLRNDGSEQLEVSQTERTDKDELSDSIYDEYRPSVTVAGAKKHPGKLVESAAMAAVSPAKVNYTPRIPSEIVRSGKISDAQLEAVIRAGNNHNQKLLDGKRKGFFIGDGTGVGKGREISAVFWDNFLQGRKKGVWVTKNSDLFKDARRDIEGIGWDKSVAFELKDYDDIKQSEGILLISYDTLKGKSKDGRTRLEQINSWLGENFDGVIAFDEAHMMANSVTTQSSRGKQKPSERALKGFDFRQANPDARVLYVSATGATEPSNLGYLERLGLWGPGTPFGRVDAFIAEVTSGGVAAMEMIAADMKAMGNYIARSLSFDGVTYGRLSHELTPEQQKVYGTYCTAWQAVMRNIEEALEVSGGKNSRQARSVALSAFWSANQRFFNQVLTSLQMPTLLKDIERQLKDGKSVILQLTNTNEAQLKRQLDNLEDGVLEDLDLTPTEIISQFVESSFPVAQMEEYTDENGNKRYRVVIDSNGNVVLNKDAVALRDRLLDELGSIRRIDGPLDMIINHFGPDAVAEITGRTTRVVWRDGEDGSKVRVKENRSKRHSEAEENDFMSGKKRILVFSEAGGTGRSFHADLSKKNQQHRIHYLVQAGWKADSAIQGLGRSHRTNEASQPHYVLCSTNVPAQVRFTSTIARRLDQLGALTRGQRQTGSQGIFQAKDNLENEYAAQAVHGFIRDLARQGSIGGLTFSEFELQSGLKLRNQFGSVDATAVEEIPVRQFLNRTLSFDLPTQELVYSEVFTRLDELVQIAESNGTLDVGMETIRAKSIVEKRSEVVRVDEDSGAKTEYHLLEGEYDAKYNNFPGEVGKSASRGYFLNEKTGRLISVVSDPRTRSSGGELNSTYYAAMAPNAYGEVAETTLQKSYAKVSTAEAERLWNEQLRELPKTYKTPIHLITGTLLPVWDRLSKGSVKIVRAQTDNGNVYLGRIIPAKSIDKVLENLGVGVNTYSAKDAVPAILDSGDEAELANGWKLKRKTVAGEKRIEIIGPDLSNREELDIAGVFAERIQYQTRFFIPKDKAVEVIEALIKNRPITSLGAPKQSDEPIYSVEYLAAKYTAKAINAGWRLIKSGITDFAKWAREMSKQFGKAIHSKLKALWKDLQEFNKQLGKRGMIKMGSLGKPGFQTMRSVTAGSETAVRGASDVVNDPGAVYLPVNHFYADSQFEYGQYLQNKYKNRNLDYILSDLATDQEAQRYYAIEYAEETDPAFRGYADDEIIYRGNRIVTDRAELRRIMARNREKFKQQQLDAYRELAERENVWYGWTPLGKRGGINPGIAVDGMKMLLDGLTKFADWSKAMLYKYSNLADEALRRLFVKINQFNKKLGRAGVVGGRDLSGKFKAPVAPVAPKAKAPKPTGVPKSFGIQSKDLRWIKDNPGRLRLVHDGKTVATLERNEKKHWLWKGTRRAFLNLGRAKSVAKQEIFKVLKEGERQTARYKKAEMKANEQAEARRHKHDDYFSRPLKDKFDGPETQLTLAEKWQNFLHKVDETLFDRWAREKRLIAGAVSKKGLAQIPESENFYQRHEVLANRIAARTEDFKESYYQPIEDYLIKNNISYKAFNRFLRVMHAEERNDHIFTINPEFRQRAIEEPDNPEYAGSGITTKEAREEIARMKADGTFGKLNKVGQMFWDLNNRLLDIQVKYGILPADVRDIIKGKYEHYAPLKSIDEDSTQLDWRALGRRSESSDQLAHAMKAIESTFSYGENTRLRRAFAKFAINNPNPALYEIKRAVKKPYFDEKTGEVKYRLDMEGNRKDILYVKNGGNDLVFIVKDPDLLASLTNKNVAESGMTERGLLFANRWLAAINTALAPEFMVANLIRDIQTAGISLSAEQSSGMAGRVLLGIPKAAKIIAQYKMGERNADGELYKEFLMQGGKIGYRDVYNLQETAKDLEKKIAEAQKGGAWFQSKTLLKDVGSFISDCNDVVESSTRLSTYIEARKSGMSKQASAALAAGVTINFQKKGTLGQAINAWYLFGAASLGGTARVASVLAIASRTPTGRKMIAGAIALGFIMDVMARMLSDIDPDDERSYYDKLLGATKDMNYVIPIPLAGDLQLKIPMPHGFSALPAMGRNLSAMMFGDQTLIQSVGNVANTLVSSFSPTGYDERGLAHTLIPTAFGLPVDLLTNSKFTGSRIKPEQNPFGAPLPQSQLVNKNTNKTLVVLTQALNKIAGGDARTPSEIPGTDVSAADIQYVIEYFTGGAGKIVSRSADLLWRVGAGEKIPVGNIPFVRRVIGEAGDYSVYDSFKSRHDQIKRFEDARRKEDAEWISKNRWLEVALNRYKVAEKAAKDIRGNDSLGDSEKRERIIVEQKRFNRDFDKIKAKYDKPGAIIPATPEAKKKMRSGLPSLPKPPRMPKLPGTR